jgi:spore maturation protein CgeB
MKINLILPSVTSLGMINDGQNVQGDELVGRLWAKNLLSSNKVDLVDLNGKRKDYDVSISFTPFVESTGGYKILYMQNSFPKPNWLGTVGVFEQVKNRYDQYIFTSEGLKEACNQKNSLVLQFATDLDLFNKKQYNSTFDHNLCYVGNPKSKQATDRYLMAVKESGLVIYGNQLGWNNNYCRGKISIENEAVAYSSSKICLNAHLEEHLEYGTFNFRIFNILACSGFVISDHSRYLEDEFKDCVVFSDGYEDLKNKVGYYLNNQEETVKFRNNGLELIKQKHTFAHRMNELLNWLEKTI